MQSKEDVLRKNVPTITFDKLIGTPIAQVLSAMEEYASQFQSPQPSKDERTYIIDLRDKVNSILVAALRELNEEQMICLRDALIERTSPSPPSKDVSSIDDVWHQIWDACMSAGMKLRGGSGLENIIWFLEQHKTPNDNPPTTPPSKVEAAAEKYAENEYKELKGTYTKKACIEDAKNHFIAGVQWAEQGKEAKGLFNDKNIGKTIKDLPDKYNWDDIFDLGTGIPTGTQNMFKVYFDLPRLKSEQGKEATPKNIEELKQRFAEHLISKNNELDTSWAYAVEWTVKNIELR